ncbi:MAG TPA: rRNA maturation RNase YbeY [Candidatus Paceibacterota bacterium]|nr:rRNA maturation RNase YbeY [Candidatus Paceibacterota bacterium]
MAVEVRNFTRRVAPRLPFEAAARAVLPGWEVSLAFMGSRRAQALNARLRGKSYVPNVLSYRTGAKSGEIIICLEEARKQASRYLMSEAVFILYLFIHGTVHLKGGVHGATMERSERKILARFAKGLPRALPHEPQNRNRNRHRHLPGEDGRRRRARG